MAPKSKVRMIFNMDKKLKDAAMKKTRRQGFTYSAFLNLVTRAYVKGRAEFDPLVLALEEARQGKTYTEEQVRRILKIPPYKDEG